MGFKTFHPFIDESYDSGHNHGKRMLMISNEIERLCKLDIQQLKKWFDNLIPILEHNKNKLLYDDVQKQSIFTEFVEEIR